MIAAACTTTWLTAWAPTEGVQAVQTVPVIRTVKRAGTLIDPS